MFNVYWLYDIFNVNNDRMVSALVYTVHEGIVPKNESIGIWYATLSISFIDVKIDLTDRSNRSCGGTTGLRSRAV